MAYNNILYSIYYIIYFINFYHVLFATVLYVTKTSLKDSLPDHDPCTTLRNSAADYNFVLSLF